MTKTKYRVLTRSGSTGQLKWREREQEEERKREGEGEQEGAEDHYTVEQTQEKRNTEKIFSYRKLTYLHGTCT